MAIKGITEKRVIPRLGKIRLGIMAPSKNGTATHPVNIDYFVVPPEVQAVYGEKPTKLDIVLPSEDMSIVFPQYLKRYTYNALACKGDGVKAMETVVETGEVREIACDPDVCQYYQSKKCKALASLMFLLPSVPGMGVWQMDTTSYYGMVGINNSLELIRTMLGRISGIPLELRRVKRTIMTRDGGKQVKRDIETVEVNTPLTIADLARLPANPYMLTGGNMVIESPADDDEPDPTLIADPQEQDEGVTRIETSTGAVKGFVGATPSQVNSLKIIIAQRTEAGISTEPIDFSKLSMEEAASEIKRLQKYKSKKFDDASDEAALAFSKAFEEDNDYGKTGH